MLNESYSITLTRNAIFEPACTGGVSGLIHGLSDNNTVVDYRDPFYASVSPQVYVLAVATAVSYVLVVMLFITPRTFFVGGPGGGTGFLSRRGVMGGSYGHSAMIGVGRRPWLQKIAALSAAVSLTIATADTFKVAQQQYELGFSDSGQVVDKVTSSLEIRTVQVISDTFLWLAQVQTLIRLFPRHKEKVVIKWLGFGLIICDALFSVLNNFVYESARTRPRTFRDAIPALTYLFELAIGFIYASCIIYFSISKRRFAFFHPKMRNIIVVAFLSIIAVLIPIVFFVLDVSKPDVAGWGDYIRWVGAAAASVVVWEWVERIEALERDERKDGILGREVFDGDEMLDITPSDDTDQRRRSFGGDGNTKTSNSSASRRYLRSRLPFVSRNEQLISGVQQLPPFAPSSGSATADNRNRSRSRVTPISRTDTISAASTQYAVHYHTVATPSPSPAQQLDISSSTESGMENSDAGSSQDPEKFESSVVAPKDQPWMTFGRNIMRAMPNPFRKQRTSPPAEVADAIRAQRRETQPTSVNGENGGSWQFFAKLDTFAHTRKERLKSRFQERTDDSALPVTIIPAQPRGHRTWSPEDFDNPTLRQNISGEQPLAPLLSNPLVTILEAPTRREQHEQSSPTHLEQHNPGRLGTEDEAQSLGSPVAVQESPQDDQASAPTNEPTSSELADTPSGVSVNGSSSLPERAQSQSAPSDTVQSLRSSGAVSRLGSGTASRETSTEPPIAQQPEQVITNGNTSVNGEGREDHSM